MNNNNPETSKLDKLRMAVGTFLALAGIVAFIFAAMADFQLTLTLAAILLIVSGLLIAGSHRLADLIAGLLR